MLRQTIWILLLLCLPACLCFADTIELKTGERIDGKFMGATSASATIEVTGQSVKVPLEKVRAIYLGAALTASQPGKSLTDEALTSLKGLHSVTETGVTIREYSSRVLDAKVKVDQYLRSASDSPIKTDISVAMKYHEIALKAWNGNIAPSGNLNASASLQDAGRSIRNDPEINSCPEVRKFLANIDAMAAKSPAFPKMEGFNSQDFLTASLMAGHLGVLWSCASERLANADLILSGKGPAKPEAVLHPPEVHPRAPAPARQPDSHSAITIQQD